MEGEAKFADIILPGLHQLRALGYRRVGQRIGYVPTATQRCNHRVIVLQHPASSRLGESKSDYEIFRGSRSASASKGSYTHGPQPSSTG